MNIKKGLTGIVIAGGLVGLLSGCPPRSQESDNNSQPTEKVEQKVETSLFESKHTVTDDFNVLEVRETSIYIENRRNSQAGSHPIQIIIAQNKGKTLGLINPYLDVRLRKGMARITYKNLKDDQISTDIFIKKYVKSAKDNERSICGDDCYQIKADGIVDKVQYNK